jgi:hypothetical protein
VVLGHVLGHVLPVFCPLCWALGVYVVRCVSFWWVWCELFLAVSIPVLGVGVGHQLCSLTMCFGLFLCGCSGGSARVLSLMSGGWVWYHGKVYSFYDMVML